MGVKVFISYANVDRDVVEQIERRLQSREIDVGIDYQAIALGDPIDKTVRQEIRSCDILLVVVSPASLKSAWVPYEIGLATDRTPRIRVIPFLTHPALDVPLYLKPYRHAKSIDELMAFLDSEVSNASQKAADSQRDSDSSHGDSRVFEQTTRVLIAGQACWDQIVWPSGQTCNHIGGSVYYVTKTIQFTAKLMHHRAQMDVWSPVGLDFRSSIEPKFRSTMINRYFVSQARTLHFKNYYVSEDDWTRRKQEVLQTSDAPMVAAEIPPEIDQKLQQGAYDFILLLPLTPYDFADIATDMVAYLREKAPKTPIGLELQGLLRDVPTESGQVGASVSDSLLRLLDEGGVLCAHANIEEGLFLQRTLAKRRGVPCDLTESSPTKLAIELCGQGFGCIGLTDGGRGSWIAWQSPDGEFCTQHSPTPDITKIVQTPHATGAGDTWFGAFTYTFLGRKLDPILAGLTATQLATLKCCKEGALGERRT